MYSKTLSLILISLSLIACKPQNSMIILEKNVEKDDKINKNISISSTNDNSITVGSVNDDITISNKENFNAIAIGDNSKASVVQINNGKNSININNAVGFVNDDITTSNKGNFNAIAIGDNSEASVVQINNGNNIKIITTKK